MNSPEDDVKSEVRYKNVCYSRLITFEVNVLRNITKNIFLNAIACSGLGWLLRHNQVSQTPTLGDQFRMEQGNEIELRARKLYPNGELVDEKDFVSALSTTKNLMGDPRISTIFAGSFFVDNFATKADILTRNTDGSWHMIEVKSGVTDKKELVDDMAYTTLVINQCGYNISKISLMVVSKDFRLGLENKDLFKEIDHTDEVLEKVEKFKPLWEPTNEITRQEEKPKSNLLFECKKCPLFKECLGQNVKNHLRIGIKRCL